jgi:hypothetical protein
MAVELELREVPAEKLTLRQVADKFRYSWKLLRRKWWLLLAIGFAGGCLGVAIAYFKKAEYEARISFSLEEGPGNALGAAASLAAQFGFDIGAMGQSPFTGDNILQIITTRRMVERTLFTIDSSGKQPQTLLRYYLSHEDLGKEILDHKRFKGIAIPDRQLDNNAYTYLQDSLLFVVYDRITKRHLVATKPDKKLSIYELLMVSPDEYFSKHLAERLLRETSAFYAELKTEKSMETLNILQRRVDSLSRALTGSIARKAGAQDANLNPALTTAQVPAQVQQVNIGTYAGAYSELFKNLELIRYQVQKEKPLFQVIEEARYPLRRIKLGRLLTGLLGVILSGFLATALLLGKAYVQNRVK